MKTYRLDEIPKDGKNLNFQNDISDDLVLKDFQLKICRFQHLGLRDVVLKDSSITQSLFEDCYMRKARFENVYLTGSTFKNCNLERASFQGCDIKFCIFENTRLNRDEIISCLPVEPNLRRNLARNLRKNFEALGDKEAADVFMNIDIKSYEQELLAIFRRATEYYKKKYNQIDQIKAGLKFIISKASGIIWGYGHRISRLLTSFIVIAFIFSLVTYFGEVRFVNPSNLSTKVLGFWESIYQAYSEALGAVTGLSPETWHGQVLQLTERFIGTLFLALLAAAAYRRITK